MPVRSILVERTQQTLCEKVMTCYTYFKILCYRNLSGAHKVPMVIDFMPNESSIDVVEK